jgi:RNA polymerase sigma-70 factor, ECF subfamily
MAAERHEGFWANRMVEEPRFLQEKALITRAQSGDLNAFEELYRANLGLIYALCMRMAGRAALAEELTQDVFVRAWEKLPSFRGESAFSTWLTRLAVNVVLGDRRQRGRREKRETHPEDMEAVGGSTRGPDPTAGLDIARAIALLPLGARAVFILHDVHGFEHAEIAAMTGSAVGTSKAQLHRARRLLRERLQ